MTLLSGAAWADDRRFDLDVPAGDLAAAVETLARQANLQVLFNRKLLEGKTTSGLHGSYTGREALEKLLEGSGIGFTFTAEDAVSLNRSAEPAGAETKPAELPEVKVTAPAETGYSTPNATTATKTDTPIMETPVAVEVVPQQVLQDQQVTSIDQALKNVSGVTVQGGGSANNGQPFSTTVLRGFETGAHFRNGVRLDSQGGDSDTYSLQFANIDRIEVLKGPAAVLYGAVEPGGIVNIVTKQPLTKPYYSVEQQFGSFDFYRTSIDATGPVTKDGRLLYRINASYEDSGSFVDLVYNRNYFVAPTLKWNIDPSTQATLEFEYRNVNFGQNFGILPLLNGKLINNDPSANYGERSPDKEQTSLIVLNGSHQFNSDWSVRQQFLFENLDTNSAGILPLGVVTPAPTASGVGMSRGINQVSNDQQTYSVNLDLTGHVETAGIKHTLLLGGDYVRFQVHGSILQAGQIDGNVSYIDVFNPVHPGTPFSGPVTPFISSSGMVDTFGLYLQDQLALPWDFHLLGGIRYQFLSQDSFANLPAFALSQNISVRDDAVTPRVGLLWRPRDWLSLYGSYAENFGPNNNSSITPDGKLVPPTSAHQWEVGAKTDSLGGRLSATLAYFDLTKTNIPTADPANPGFVLLIGEARSTGLELDLQGEVLPGWNIIANYAYTNARVTQASPADTSNPVGSPLGGVPKDLGHLWTTYEFQFRELRGLKIGAGATYNGPEPYLFAGTSSLRIPGYATLDLTAGYSFKLGLLKSSVQLNATNILDKIYIINSELPTTDNPPYGTQRAVIYGAPRTLLGSLKIEF